MHRCNLLRSWFHIDPTALLISFERLVATNFCWLRTCDKMIRFWHQDVAIIVLHQNCGHASCHVQVFCIVMLYRVYCVVLYCSVLCSVMKYILVLALSEISVHVSTPRQYLDFELTSYMYCPSACL